MPRSSFFIVGAPKCGTTSLYHYLRQHPDIFMPDRKEPCFFGSDLDVPRECKNEDDYLTTFTRTAKPMGGEGTTWYLYSKTAAREIYSFNFKAKIVIVVRNPVDMVYSLFRYRRHGGGEKSSCLSDVLDRENEYLSNLGNQVSIKPDYVYADAARYHDQIRRYVETFGSASVHVVVFDDMKDHPEKVYCGILRFLGVSDHFRPTFRHVNKTGQIRSERFQQRITHPPAPIRRLAYALPQGVRLSAFRALHRLNTSYAVPPPLDPGLRRRLNHEFRPDVERLSALLGRDLTHWCAE
jgi:Sulfotransferase domain